MLGRFIRDESGMTMALTVVMIVLIGVMGAGILVFVQRDLESVVEVNQGQRAFELADAGVQAAKRQLLTDAFRQHYDTVHTNDCANSNSRTGSDWSPTTTGYPSLDCTGTPITKSAGVTRNFVAGKFNVTIQCFIQPEDPSPSPCQGGSGAPESVPADTKTFFKVTSTGYYPADGSGAKRKIETIYNTKDLGVPKAYFTPDTASNSIFLTGSSDVRNISLFTLGGVQLAGGASVSGADLAYDNWYRPPYNTASRTGPTCTTTLPDGTTVTKTCAGIGAVGNIDSEVLGEDYDGADGPNPRFVKDPSDPQNASTEMTFPFDYKTQIPGSDADSERIDFLREIAREQGNYYTSTGGVVNMGSASYPWPDDSGPNTVVFMEYTGAGGSNRVDWLVGDDSDPPVEGTLIIKGGNFKLQQHKACLEGVVIVRGGIYEDGDSMDAGNNTCLDGFVNATGQVEIKGHVDTIAPADVINRPGFYKLQTWSWRELYK